MLGVAGGSLLKSQATGLFPCCIDGTVPPSPGAMCARAVAVSMTAPHADVWPEFPSSGHRQQGCSPCCNHFASHLSQLYKTHVHVGPICPDVFKNRCVRRAFSGRPKLAGLGHLLRGGRVSDPYRRLACDKAASPQLRTFMILMGFFHLKEI